MVKLKSLKLKRDIKKQSEEASEMDSENLYCGNCGTMITKAFLAGQFVLVDVPGTTRFFGKFMGVSHSENGKVMVKIAKNELENVSVPIEYLYNVGRKG